MCHQAVSAIVWNAWVDVQAPCSNGQSTTKNALDLPHQYFPVLSLPNLHCYPSFTYTAPSLPFPYHLQHFPCLHLPSADYSPVVGSFPSSQEHHCPASGIGHPCTSDFASYSAQTFTVSRGLPYLPSSQRAQQLICPLPLTQALSGNNTLPVGSR